MHLWGVAPKRREANVKKKNLVSLITGRGIGKKKVKGLNLGKVGSLGGEGECT